MAYVKNIWVDQDVERPKTYEVTNNQDGSITLTDSFGLVTELGTPVNETNMNHIEDGIDGCAIRKHNLTETFDLGEWVWGGNPSAIYESLVANNTNNALTDTAKWKKAELVDLSGKQDVLTFDNVPTDNSENPVKSNGIYDALQSKQDTLTFDNTPTQNSSNPVKSGGVYDAINNAGFLSFNNVNDSLKGVNWAISKLPSANSGYWSAIAYNGSIFVALNSEAYTSTSTDGITWTTPAQFSSNLSGWTDLAYGNGIFVAISGLNYKAISTDGTNWTNVGNAGASTNLRGLTFDNEKFVAIKNTGALYSSTDGISWSQLGSVSPGSGVFESIVYGNGKFIAFTSVGNYKTSADGVTWDSIVTLDDRDWLGATYSNGQFIIIDENGYIRTSTNGTTWTDAKIGNNLGVRDWQNLGSYSNKFVAINKDGNVAICVNDNQEVVQQFPYVKNYYKVSDTYVREWSDGTLEQWCYRYTQSSAGAYTITYPVKFTTEPLLITTYTLASSATTSTTTRNYGYTTSETGFTVYLAANGRLAWYTRGY